MVLIHPNFLADDALLLGHGFRGEVRLLDKFQKGTEGFREILRAGKHIAGLVEGGEGVGVRAGPGEEGEGVAVLALKQFMLQIMGDAVGDLLEFRFPFQLKFIVNGTVVCSEHRVSRPEPFHGIQKDAQAGFMLQAQVLLIQPFAADY